MPRTFEEGRGRVRQAEQSPVDPAGEHQPAVEQGLRTALDEAGLKVGRIETEVHAIHKGDRRARRWGPRLADRMVKMGGELVIAVEQPGKGWLVLSAPWPRAEAYLVWRLIWQTLVLYAIMLIPVLWIGRRLSQPLRSLAVGRAHFHARRGRCAGRGTRAAGSARRDRRVQRPPPARLRDARREGPDARRDRP